MKKLRYILELILVQIVLLPTKFLGYEMASNLGGFLFRNIGIITPANKVVKANLRYIYPNWAEDKISSIAKKAWDNFGRTCAESLYLSKMSNEKFWHYFSVEDDFFNKINKKHGQVIFVSAHIGNWEVLPQAAFRLNTKMAFIYRFANNPYINKLIQEKRGKAHELSFEKNSAGTVKFFKAMLKGASCGLLLDQRLNSGIELTLLGKPAMSQQMVADIAEKFKTVIVPVRPVRKNKFYQTLVADKPIDPKNKSKEQICQLVNDHISKWVNDTPEQWFWQHDRWSLKKSGKLEQS